MASAQQIRANQANAQLSTGPNDTSRTRFNGASHGLTSRQAVIPGEDPAEHAAFAAAFTVELDPQSETERFLAQRLVAAAWRLRRFTRMETAFLNSRVEAFLENHAGADPDLALANLFADPEESKRMRLFLRYQTAVQREFDTARKLYENERRDRLRQSLERAALAPQEPTEPLASDTSPVGATARQTAATAVRTGSNGFGSYHAGACPDVNRELYLKQY